MQYDTCPTSSGSSCDGGGEEGGKEQQASCLVAKQAMEFPQVVTSSYNFSTC